ncbi:MAG: hypothetical protein LBQ79_05045 [Deltaproteobacteria bacterium]|jgi:hypothetical protein|nr:hypothetical protein [Deltaproteobacteria bacterium]
MNKLCRYQVLAVITLLAAALTLAQAVPVSAQPDWLEIDTQKDFPALKPAFTVRYPPGFQKQEPPQQGDGSHPGPNGGGFSVGDYFLLDKESGAVTTLSTVRWWWTPQEKQVAEDKGLKTYWEFLGQDMANKMQDSYEGADFFDYQRHQAADIFFSGPATLLELDEPYSIVGLTRSVAAEDGHVLMNCFVMLPKRVADGWGGTARDYPDTAKICRPYFDSLQFKN